jgi:hypothetical protein
MTVTIDVGSRAYVKSFDNFGQISRPTFLGLVNAPVVQLDDGSFVGMAGKSALEDVVPTSTGKNYSDQTVVLPLDVKTVGTATLTGLNIPADKQTLMFEKFVKLPKDQRTALADQWIAVSTGTDADKKAFVDKMVAALA